MKEIYDKHCEAAGHRWVDATTPDGRLTKACLDDVHRTVEGYIKDLSHDVAALRAINDELVAALELVAGSPVMSNGIYDGTDRTVSDVVKPALAAAKKTGR